MSAGLRNSTIETYRKRFHGNDILRIYRLAKSGDSLVLIHEIVKGFYIGTNTDTAEGAANFLLTIDLIYTPTLAGANLILTAWADLIDPITEQRQRYRVNTDTQPIIGDWRYVLGLHAAYNDKKAVIIENE